MVNFAFLITTGVKIVKCATKSGPHKWAKTASIEQAKHPKGNSVAPTNLCVV